MSRDRPPELGGGYGQFQLRWDDESLIWFGNSCVTRLPVLFLRVTGSTTIRELQLGGTIGGTDGRQRAAQEPRSCSVRNG